MIHKNSDKFLVLFVSDEKQEMISSYRVPQKVRNDKPGGGYGALGDATNKSNHRKKRRKTNKSIKTS